MMTTTETPPGLCAECVERTGDTNPNSRCAHGCGHACAYDGGNAVAYNGGNAVAEGGGNAWVAGAGDAEAHDGGDAVAMGGGNAVAYGGGNAWAHGGGNAVAYGGGGARAFNGGTETDHRGTRRPVAHDGIRYECLAGDGWLRVGCEIRRYEEWIEKADEIDARHGDGIAHLTRALAQRLIDGEVK